ncbi:histidine phosphatase family protein [Lachnoclostridium phytofermentans]|uniref:Phosphoglycerate mutase n=1 Tax=Lachnoclostridium phytofermentans (strain ATCC 700394 / DSM 18823 / ISDg) TaxID=357809 RepID=A9KMP2_LACP7|nr:histidine phosphatase family protein [Lachnoclostridium phytofermentans]ABX41487.1 Phosphoglycerate mutase [Lachnoclostridium phytofermentans ISDg]
MKRIALIRHGLTKGNLSKCYIGKTDEPLCEEGINELLLKKERGCYPSTENIYCSPMLRCQMTANLIYPNRELKFVHDFRECDFGLFEGKNYKQLSNEPLYQQWIDSNGTMPFPSGEAREEFEHRCREAYRKVINEVFTETSMKNMGRTDNRIISEKEADAALIVHGGTIMAILSAFAKEKKDYYAWGCGNGEGYLLEVRNDGRLEVIREI